jgi:hypothetical protein
MNKKEHEVILNFLKSGFSTRQLDNFLGNKNTRGWVSWDILKKYGLKNLDKGKLFLYSTAQSNKIIKLLNEEVKEGRLDKLKKLNPPKNLQKYENTWVIASSEKSFYNVLSGETRNIIRDFFNPEKKLIGKCQFNGCKNKGQIDTVHFSKDRPQIFMECAKENKTKLSKGLFKFDVYKTMMCFLKSHSKNKSICFLCKNHHNELHEREKKAKKQLREFKKKIIF